MRTEATIRALTAALWAGAVASVAAAVWLPYRLASGNAVATGGLALRQPSTSSAATAEGFDDLLDLSLRRPLVDPPPTAAVPPTFASTAPAAPALRLAGIVVEPGHSFALFVDAGGASLVRTVGQRAGGADVVAIAPAAVTVRSNGQLVTLRLAPAPRP